MGEMTLMDFMREGGWSMWPVLIFGIVGLGTAVRFAHRPSGERLACAAAMWVTVACAVLHGMLSDVAAVLHGVSDPDKFPDSVLVRALLTGFKESTRPGVLGGIFLTLGALGVAIGFYRGRGADAL